MIVIVNGYFNYKFYNMDNKNIQTLVINLDDVGFKLIVNTPTLKNLFHINQLNLLKEGINIVNVSKPIANKMMNLFNINNPLNEIKHISCENLNSIIKNQSQLNINSGKLYYGIIEGNINLENSNLISYFKFKNRKKDIEKLPIKNSKIIILTKEIDKIILSKGDWIPYNGITQDNLFCELNENDFPKYPANGYLGSFRTLTKNNIEIGFNAWEQNNSEFIIWREYEEGIYKLLELLFQSTNEKILKKLYNDLEKI